MKILKLNKLTNFYEKQRKPTLTALLVRSTSFFMTLLTNFTVTHLDKTKKYYVTPVYNEYFNSFRSISFTVHNSSVGYARQYICHNHKEFPEKRKYLKLNKNDNIDTY